MTENKRFYFDENGINDREYEFSILGEDELVDIINELNDENKQLKQQMRRLYNYFADWFDGRVPQSDFSEMWDFVKEDEKWD